ncbi:unnamed protein product [Paramecium octaurelia]|uniref:Kinesin motor domain-containing protein n=1 Tax=Paramecium octaurelia TaxID=43137 RepID=A0A8S1VE88_PAROT|nr:unnamed protein product [Paramecium octaurelia]
MEVELHQQIPPQLNVQVAIRVRPFNEKELKQKEGVCLETSEKQVTLLQSARLFTFDYVFDQNASQDQVYKKCVSNLVQRCFEGYNSTILAYGQTGSGKTHTMGTTGVDQLANKNNMGMIPRVITQIFEEIEKIDQEILISCSYLELYNEQIIDLLQETSISSQPTIREEKDRTITILNLTTILVNNPNEMLQVLNRGAAHRTTAATQMNMTSSRSHAIFTIYFKINPKDDSEDGTLNAKFHFVDLAGSERLKKTLAQGKTMEEGININQSLLVLGNVIKTLSDQKKKSQTHIPYRESKLTRILQDSLGGNSNTCMIACVSPAESNYEETLNTLKYASRAREIQNKPTQNRDPHAIQILGLRQEIAALVEQNKQFQELLQVNGVKFDSIKKVSVSQYSSNIPHTCEEHLEMIQKQKQALLVWERLGSQHKLEVQKLQSQINDQEIELHNLKKKKDIIFKQFQEAKKILQKFNIPYTNYDEDDEIEDLYDEVDKLKQESKEKEYKILTMQKEIDELLQDAHRDQYILCKKQKELMILQRKLEKLEPKDNFESPAQDSECDEEVVCNDSMIKETNLQIEEFESNLQVMTIKNFELKRQLAEDMKKEFQQQISILEAQKSSLMKQVNQKQDATQMNALKVKLQEYESKINEMRLKEQNMRQMQKKLEEQENQVKDLKINIEKMKKQKVELIKKMKQDNEKYIKDKEEKQKELILIKKLKIQQDAALSKLKNENCKKEVLLRRKEDEILKQRNEKVIDKGSSLSFKKSQKAQTYDSMEKQIESLFSQLISGGQAENQIKREITKLEQLQEEVNQIEQKICQLQIKREQTSFDQNNKNSLNQIELELSDIIIIRENINETIDYQLHKIEQLRKSCNNCTEVYTNFLTNSELRDLPNWCIKIFKYVIDNWIKDHLQMQNFSQQNDEFQQIIQELQQQLQKPLQEINCNSPTFKKKIIKSQVSSQPSDALELRKQLNDQKRKYQFLQNENKNMISDLDYYKKFYTEHINKVQKDKCIGLSDSFQLPQSQSYQQIRDAYKLERTKQKELSLNLSFQKPYIQNSALKMAKVCKSEREGYTDQFSQAQDEQELRYDLIKSIPGHENPILCVYTMQNLLCSSAFRSVKIWDMDAQSHLISLDANTHVKSICHWPERNAIAVSHGSQISLYDMTSFQLQSVLKSSIEEIRVMTRHNGLLVAGGKGINYAMNVWDARSNNQIHEFEKQSDVMCLQQSDQTQELIWGTFNHNVRKMMMNSNKYGQIAQMTPPHYDKVTGVGLLDNWIVSCSFGKGMRMWNQVNGQQGQANSDIHKDSILTMAIDKNLKVMYTGCKDGQIKATRISENKFQLVSDISASVQQINSLNIINDSSLIVSGGQDRMIKIWKPSKFTFDYLKQFTPNIGDFIIEEEQYMFS